MSDKQTYCPSCLTTYKVTVAQLTVAQGMVCCPKCDTSFNALTHLVAEKKESSNPVVNQKLQRDDSIEQETNSNGELSMESSPLHSHILLQIFDRKVENSNIDLKTYLNNLNYFSTEPIGTLPAVNWSEDTVKKHGPLYYAGWTAFNLVLIGTLVFQFFWFNPQYLKNSPIMSQAFNHVCEIFSCSNLQEHYNLISTKKVKVKSPEKNLTHFSGELVNYHDRSLALPLLRVNLKEDGLVIATYNLQPQEYLIKNLHGIERIPKNSPFKFDFTLPIDRKNFDNYEFEIIRP